MNLDRWTFTRGHGETIHDVLEQLSTLGTGLTFEVVSIARAPSFRGSHISSTAQTFTAGARERHFEYGFGYWEFLLASLVGAPSNIRQPVIDRAGFHTGGDARRVDISSLLAMIRSGELVDMPDRTMLSLSSRVWSRERSAELHLPMLDFSLKSDGASDPVAVEVLESLELSGYLLDSGRSYHFIGMELLTPKDMRILLARAQLLSPYIDSRWISHSLIEERCALRITSDSDRNAVLPHIVASSVPVIRSSNL